MSVIGYSTCRTVRSRSTTSVSRLSRLTPAARNVGSRRAAVSVRSASESSGKRSPSFSAKARCSSGRCTETPCTVAPAAANSANWSRYVHDSRRETPSSCWSASNWCTPRAVSRTISRVHQSPTTSSAWAIEQSASARLVLRPALRRGRGRHLRYATLPVFLADHGHGPQLYGWLLAINGGVILCLELPAAHVLRRRAPLGVVGVGLLLVGLGYAVLIPGAGVFFAVAMMFSLTLGEVLYKTPRHRVRRRPGARPRTGPLPESARRCLDQRPGARAAPGRRPVRGGSRPALAGMRPARGVRRGGGAGGAAAARTGGEGADRGERAGS